MAENKGKIKFLCKDVYGDLLTDTVRLEFRNRKERSLDFNHTMLLEGKELTLAGVPAFPTGSWELHILPDKYRHKKLLLEVPSSREVVVNEVFFINPSSVTPIFPEAEELPTSSRWTRLLQTIPLSGSGVSFDGLDDQQKAGLLNLYAKMSDAKSHSVFDSVISIFEVRPARIFARVGPTLWDKVKGLPAVFDPQPGGMHPFKDGWTRLAQDSSFKTNDPTGNLQPTFATNSHGEWAIDADVDDHRGIKHAFDVVKHKVSSGDTHPYDIHQILTLFQKIDPGYQPG